MHEIREKRLMWSTRELYLRLTTAKQLHSSLYHRVSILRAKIIVENADRLCGTALAVTLFY